MTLLLFTIVHVLFSTSSLLLGNLCSTAELAEITSWAKGSWSSHVGISMWVHLSCHYQHEPFAQMKFKVIFSTASDRDLWKWPAVSDKIRTLSRYFPPLGKTQIKASPYLPYILKLSIYWGPCTVFHYSFRGGNGWGVRDDLAGAQIRCFCVMLPSGSHPQFGKLKALQLMHYFISVISCLKHHFL